MGSRELKQLQASMISQSLYGVEIKMNGAENSAWRASRILDDSEFGRGRGVLFYKTVLDIVHREDSVWELIYPQNPMRFRPHEPAEGKLLGICHLPHAGISWKPDDLTVLTYTDREGTEYRLHPSRFFQFKDLVAKHQPGDSVKRWAELFEDALSRVLGVKCTILHVQPEMHDAAEVVA